MQASPAPLSSLSLNTPARVSEEDIKARIPIFTKSGHISKCGAQGREWFVTQLALTSVAKLGNRAQSKQQISTAP